MSGFAWRAQPPDEPAEAPREPEKDEDAEVVNLAAQRLAAWLRGMFGAGKPPEEPDDRD